MRINVGKIFAGRAFLTPDLEAWVGQNYRYTFNEANLRLNRFAGFLTASQVREGDRIAVLCKNNEHVIAAMMAAAKIGAITVLLNWRLQVSELEYILSDCGAGLLLYDSEFSGAVEALNQRIGGLVLVRVGAKGPGSQFESAISDYPPEEPTISGGGDDPALLMYTSGTTGKPKGVCLTHNNLFWAVIGLTHTLDWPHGSRFLSVAPLFHIGGLAPIMANIHMGCTSVFLPDFDPAKVWESIVEEKITFLMTVPLMLQYMKLVPGIDKMDLGALKHIICGGSPVPQSLIFAYRDMGIDVLHVYGATEYAGAITFWMPSMGEEKSNSMGKPVFHGDVKILSPEDVRELPAGEVGEICLLGPQVFKGYWNNEVATKAVLRDGGYRSGDLGKKDEDGFVYVIDRLKDMIISGGENIYPAEIEAVIVSHPAVAEVAVVGRPDEKWGEVPVAVVVKQPGSDVGKADIISLCKGKLAGFKCVKDVIFTDVIPKNSVGKVLKRNLKEQIGG